MKENVYKTFANLCEETAGFEIEMIRQVSLVQFEILYPITLLSKSKLIWNTMGLVLRT